MTVQHCFYQIAHSCPGYQKFLSKQRYGKNYSFNWWFFFFSPIWLVHNKMYFHYSLMILTYLNVAIIGQYLGRENFNEINFTFLLGVLHIFFSLFSHKIYHIHLQNRFYNAKYDINKCLKIVTPHSAYIQIGLNILIPIFTVWVTQIFITTINWLF